MDKKIDNSKAFAIDTETDSISTVSANLIGISISVKEKEGCYIPIGHSYENCPEQLSLDYIQKNSGLLSKEIKIKLLVKI